MLKRSITTAVLCLTLLIPTAEAQRTRSVAVGSTIHIGALLSLTGDWSTLGLASAAALEIAARDINAEFQLLRIPFHVQYSVADTALDPSLALQRLDELTSQGATFIIGPQSSAEAAAIRERATAQNLIVISQGSTASSLAIPGDNLFRFAPNDRSEGAAIASLMKADGIEVVVPAWRADAGNIGLHLSTRAAFVAAGGSVSDGIEYGTSVSDFSGTVSAIGAAVRAAKATRPLSKIAVYLAAFDEAAQIFELARTDSDLASVRWYGGDGVAQSQALLTSSSVAGFAASVSFVAPNVGLDDSMRDAWEPVANEIRDRVGFDPDAFALSVYDAAWVSALSAVHSRGHADLRRESFVRTVQRYFGITGPTMLDSAGDRRIGNYDFWQVRMVGGEPRWVRSGQYVNGVVVR